ncbi:MAG: hypothetical protein RBG13Loki_3938 [Promethearchaeota archaeon CR_4]|nr:MAG: hypothetical protein RBG13Loki_3938 [Candidatus Lokiarchaeota archaeon CR_4]
MLILRQFLRSVAPNESMGTNMVRIKPFRGYYYNLAKIRDFAQVITPPYDVISPESEKLYYERSPYNFARVDLPKASGSHNPYENAANLLQSWMKEKVLVQDPEPALYVYSHTYANDNNSTEITRFGFVSLLDLAPGNDVFAHEQTLQKPFEDRLHLMEATRVYFGLIFLLYDDQERVIDRLLESHIRDHAPLIHFKDNDGVLHKLWSFSNTDHIKRITREMEKYSCVIADGHHRFKVARQYYKECVEHNQDPESARWPMVCFVNSYHEGFAIRPTNRVLFNLPVPPDLVKRLQEKFDVTEEKDIITALRKVRTTSIMVDETQNIKNIVIAMFDNTKQKAYFLRLWNPTALKSGHSDIYTKIDVNVLHTLIFQDILGISSEDEEKGTKLTYVKGDEATLDLLRLYPKKYILGFFINPPLKREIFMTARNGEKMPQKSTYFYPKLFSGIILHKLPELPAKKRRR